MKAKPTKIIIAVSSAIILLSSCAERDKTSPEPPSTGDIISASLPTEVSTEPTPELTTVEDTQISTEPSTEPTTEPSTQPTTEATTTKPTEKTTEKTTVKTQKTKSTTTEKPKTSQTTAEDVPLPEPEAIAERPEKLTQELRDWVASASEGDIIEVYIFRESISDDVIDALVQSEYGFEPETQDDDAIDVEGPVDESPPDENEQETIEYINALIKARRTILKREYTKLNDEFIANYIPKERKVVYAGDYTSTIIVEATAEEILFYSSLPQVEEISSDFGLGEPESSVDVEEPTTSD